MRRDPVAAAVAVALILLVAAVVLAPGAAGHAGEDHDGGSSDGAGDTSGGSGRIVPLLRGYDTYLGQRFWGHVSSVPTPDHEPSEPAISKGWVAWVARNGTQTDIHAYNLSKGIRVEVTDDDAGQREPSIDGARVVWREETEEGYRVEMYDLANGRSETIATVPAIVKNPTINGRWIAWQDRRGADQASRSSSSDVYAYDLEKERELPVATGATTDVDPAVVGDDIAWRQREYGQWDVHVQTLTTGQTKRITADVNREVNLRSGEDSFVYLQQHRSRPGYHAYRYYPSADRTVDLGFDAPSSTGAHPAGDAVVIQENYVSNATLAIRTIEADGYETLHTGRLDYRHVTTPANRSMALVVGTQGGRDLVTYQYDRLADDPPPEVSITEPKATDVVGNTTTVKGRVEVEEPWPEPTRVFVSLDAAEGWVLASGTLNWTASVDLTDVNPGRHSLTATAEFPTGPTWSTDVRIAVGSPADFTQDLSDQYGAESKGLVAAILGTIPLLIVLILAIAAIILFAARTYFRWLRERYPDAQYVPPDDPGPPHDNPAEAAAEGDEPTDGGARS
jgi:beta propeller repeat protein